ncbi:PoNi-like cognate immunity protein [Acinetobacter baumannii]|nr:PoNi-like cognate immunity protein [Acinetobacter baumannii]
MSNFTEQRRQQFLTEDYYLKTKEYNEEGIPLYLKSDAFEDDQYNCGEANRWTAITDIYTSLLYLTYTAGHSIQELIPVFEKVIDGYEKQSEALALFHKSEKPSVITSQNETLNILSLAFLLHRNDLFLRIHSLVNGERDSHTGEDEIINKFFKLNDSTHPTINEGNLFSLSYAKLCDVIDNVLVKSDKKHSVELLDEYLSNWYQMNRNEIWYNSHLDLENKSSYVGYWAFEAAALVYLLDLDDSSLYKHLFYPKDIVQWARNQTKIKALNDDVIQIKLRGGEKCTRTGYWQTPAQPNLRRYFVQDKVLPTLIEMDWGEVYWYWDGEN